MSCYSQFGSGARFSNILNLSNGNDSDDGGVQGSQLVTCV